MAWATMDNNLPQLLASLVCDDVALSERDGRVSLQRIFFDISAIEFPATLDRLAVVNFWSGGRGVFNVRIEVAGPIGDESTADEDLTIIASGEVAQEMRPEWVTNVHLLVLVDVTLPKPGIYAITVHLDGVVIHGYELLVIQRVVEPAPEAVASVKLPADEMPDTEPVAAAAAERPKRKRKKKKKQREEQQ